MSRQPILTFASVALLVLIPTRSWADEQDELRERFKALKEKAQALAKEGRHEEVEALKREGQKLAEALKRHHGAEAQPGTELDARIHKHEANLADLRDKLEKFRELAVLQYSPTVEIKERIVNLEKELDQLRAARKRQHEPAERPGDAPEKRIDEKVRAAKERLEHMSVAADHLQKAGLNELAEQIRSKLDHNKRELEDHLRQIRQSAAAKAERHPSGDDAEIRELRELVKRLQAEIHELREQSQRR